LIEVFEKWGFGLAPPKSKTQRARVKAAHEVLGLLENPASGSVKAGELDSLSAVKGLFNRVVRQDQWDWFTVARHLGYPSAGISKVIAEQLSALRIARRNGDTHAGLEAWSALRRLPTQKCLEIFIGRLAITDENGAGWVYILSAREFPSLLKIGMTTRSVEDRAREINSATGVPIPFGVRSCWRVKDPQAAERLVHSSLLVYRIRGDREFFKIDFFKARDMITNVLSSASLEIRTLNALTSLQDAPMGS